MTQVELAKAIALSQRMITFWENNVLIPNTRHMINICRVLEVTPNELLGWKNDGGKNHQEPADLQTDNGESKRTMRRTSNGKRAREWKGRLAADEKGGGYYKLIQPSEMTMGQLRNHLCYPTPRDGCANCSSPCKYGMELEKRKAEGVKG